MEITDNTNETVLAMQLIEGDVIVFGGEEWSIDTISSRYDKNFLNINAFRFVVMDFRLVKLTIEFEISQTRTIERV